MKTRVNDTLLCPSCSDPIELMYGWRRYPHAFADDYLVLHFHCQNCGPVNLTIAKDISESGARQTQLKWSLLSEKEERTSKREFEAYLAEANETER